MFEDLFSLTSQHKDKFSDTVRDQFGKSIISEIFEPMLQEISGLQHVEEFFRARAAEIDRTIEETRDLIDARQR